MRGYTRRWLVLSFSPLLLGCQIIPAAKNSDWIADGAQHVAFVPDVGRDGQGPHAANVEDCNGDGHVSESERTAAARRSAPYELRFFALHAQPVDDPSRTRTKSFALAGGEVASLVVQGASALYDYVVKKIEDEAKDYHRSFTAIASGDDFYVVRDATKPGWRTRGVVLSASEINAWLGSGPEPGAIVPPGLLAQWEQIETGAARSTVSPAIVAPASFDDALSGLLTLDPTRTFAQASTEIAALLTTVAAQDRPRLDAANRLLQQQPQPTPPGGPTTVGELALHLALDQDRASEAARRAAPAQELAYLDDVRALAARNGAGTTAVNGLDAELDRILTRASDLDQKHRALRVKAALRRGELSTFRAVRELLEHLDDRIVELRRQIEAAQLAAFASASQGSIPLSAREITLLRKMYVELHAAHVEAHARGNKVAPPLQWTLNVYTFQVSHLDTFVFLRSVSPPSGEKLDESVTRDPLSSDRERGIALHVEGKVDRAIDNQSAQIAITGVTLRAAGAKSPDERWWLPVELIDDAVEARADLSILARVEHAFIDEDGKLQREVLLDEPVAQLSGIELDAPVRLVDVLHPSTGERNLKMHAIFNFSRPLDRTPYRSRSFALPRPNVLGVPPSGRGRSSGIYTLSISVDESNKAEDLLRRAAELARENREDILERIREGVEEISSEFQKPKR